MTAKDHLQPISNSQGPGQTKELALPQKNGPHSLEVDFSELRFFDFMTTLVKSNATQQKASPKAEVISLLEPDPNLKSTQESSPKSRLNQALTENSASSESASIEEVHQELDRLTVDLKEEDVRFLQQVMIHGLPMQGAAQPLVFDKNGNPQNVKLSLSKNFSELIQQAYKTGRPIRVELDDESSIILKIHRGKVSAEFLSKDASKAGFLQQQLDLLRQRLESRNLPVANLTYRDPDDQHNSNQNHQEQEQEQHHFDPNNANV